MKLPILSCSILLLAPIAAFAIGGGTGSGIAPEPSEFALLTVGAAVAALVAWKRKSK